MFIVINYKHYFKIISLYKLIKFRAFKKILVDLIVNPIGKFYVWKKCYIYVILDNDGREEIFVYRKWTVSNKANFISVI